MKLFVFIMLMVTALFHPVYSQFPVWNDPNSLPQWMTPEEELRKHEIGKDVVASPPPSNPIRQVAEFERMEAVLIRYPLGISTALVAAMSQHVKVLTIVSNTSNQNAAMNAYQAAGANMANCLFLIAPTDSYWTRDYGPWYVTEGNNQVSIINFNYNRPRPNDNAIPGKVAQYYGIPWYTMNLTTAGGNYMCDSYDIAASTDLVYQENGNNPALVNQLVHDYLGINTYHVTIDPPGDYIKHIDCWGKFLDVDKILIGQVPPTHNRYWAYEEVASYFANQISAYGTPYQVFRVYTPNLQPYTNSLILNNRVYVPIVNSPFDAQAIQTYQNAMPGYQVLGFTGSWQSTDALHCRTLGLADRSMLYISHIPLHGLHEYQPEFQINATIIPYSGQPLKTDSLFVIYKINQGVYDTVPLAQTMGNSYTGIISITPGDTLVTYYLFAADHSGRRENWPLIGAPGARSFQITIPPDILVRPDSLLFVTYDQAYVEGLPLIIKNPSNTVLTVQDIQYQPWPCYIEPAPVLPYQIAAGDSLVLRVYLNPVPQRPAYELLDTIRVVSSLKTHHVPVWGAPDLFNRVDVPALASLIALSPNPFNNHVNLKVVITKPTETNVSLYDMQGRMVYRKTLNLSEPGLHQVVLNTESLSNPGIYTLQLTAGNALITRKLIKSH